MIPAAARPLHGYSPGDPVEAHGNASCAFAPTAGRPIFFSTISRADGPGITERRMNYFKTAARMLRKNRLYSLLNVFGLAIGLASFLMIAWWAFDELSFDDFHANAGRIYRIDKVYTPTSGGRELHALTPGPMAPAMTDEFPEIESAVRINPWFSDILLQNGDDAQPVGDVVFADSNLFDVFSFKLLAGDAKTALATPASIVLSESLARRFFGDTDPIGRALTGFGGLTYTVTGIVEDTPARSHLQYNAFLSWSTVDALQFSFLQRWLPQTLYTYVLLRPDASAQSVDARLPDFTARHLPTRVDQYHFYLQPLRDIYLGSRAISFQRSVVLGSRSSVEILGLVGILILVIACVNFVNLSTAQAGRRSVEVGIRKSIGAGRRELVTQFLVEAFVLTVIAFGLALLLVEAVRPLFNAVADKSTPALAWLDPVAILVLFLLAGIVGVAAGIYPAFVLTRFNATRALRGSASGRRGNVLQKTLVTAQFAASIALLFGTAVIYRQMQFVQAKNPGYDREQIVVLPIGPTDIGGQIDAFKQELLSQPGVLSVSVTSDVPGTSLSSYSITPEGRTDDDGLIASAIYVNDTDMLKTYGLQLAEGRYFSEDRPADTSAVVINEAMMRSLGWTEAVGKEFRYSGDAPGTVIGVLKDFDLASARESVEPLFLAYGSRPGNVSVRVAPASAAESLVGMKSVWTKFESRYPFEYHFLDDNFARLYDIDRRLMRIMGAFSLLAIAVASLGLFGLATYAAERRRKEVGVRKVLGAGVTSIVALLSKDFALLVVIAFAIAAPVAYLLMRRWLDSFVYRVDPGFGILALTGGIVLMVAIATVSVQALRAARQDPVRSLRYE